MVLLNEYLKLFLEYFWQLISEFGRGAPTKSYLDHSACSFAMHICSDEEDSPHQVQPLKFFILGSGLIFCEHEPQKSSSDSEGANPNGASK